MANIFDKRGELSAENVQEALSDIVKFASVIDQLSPSSSAQAQAASMTDTERDRLISEALMTHQGKIALGQSMVVPIRRNLDYQGVGRKALVVDPLPQGAMPMYERDVDVSAVVISSNGTAPESRVFGDRVTIPEFEIVSNPTVRHSEVKRRKFNVIDRAQQKAHQEIQAHEDAAVFSALDFASDTLKGGENTFDLNTLQGPTGGRLSKLGLLSLKRKIDGWDMVTAKYFMNINEFTDMLGWESAGGAGASQVDPVTQREVLKTGLYGSIFASDIIVSKIVPQKQVFACAEPELVGIMPVRQDIEVIPADEPKQLKLGWVVSEIIGVGIVNPRGVASGTVGPVAV